MLTTLTLECDSDHASETAFVSVSVHLGRGTFPPPRQDGVDGGEVGLSMRIVHRSQPERLCDLLPGTPPESTSPS